MKIGIITFNSAHNYGAVLQVWALQEKLKQEGHQVEVINYRIPAIDNLYRIFVPKRISSKAWINRVCHKLQHVKAGMRIPEATKKYEKFEHFIQKILPTTVPYRNLDELRKADLDYDVLIAGSDQIWNGSITRGINPAYFLEFGKKQAKRISYAASIGKDTFDEDEKILVQRYLKNFDYISVREEKAKIATEELTEKEVDLVLDPTLLLDREKYDALRVDSGIKQDYIFVHNVHLFKVDERLNRMVEEVSKRTGWGVINNRSDYKFTNEIGKFTTGGPKEFLGMIAGAKMVITNSFHATVFSIIYEREFITVPHFKNPERMRHLLHMFGIDNHLIGEVNDLPEDLEQIRIDYTKVNELRKAARISSEEFIKKALNGEKTTDLEITEKDLYLHSKDMYHCYGCGACKDSCVNCSVVMERDQEGFQYPAMADGTQQDMETYKNVCIFGKEKELANNSEAIACYSAYAKDELVHESSVCGGVFEVMASYAINNGWKVVGVKTKENGRVAYAMAETLEEIKEFQGIKPVEADVNDIKIIVKQHLDKKENVLFAGTPCQIAGLRSFLGTEYPNLYTVENICKGVPSPKAYYDYLGEIEEIYDAKVKHIDTGKKVRGATKPYLCIEFDNDELWIQSAKANEYMKAVSSGLLQRPMCYVCKFVHMQESVADLTLGINGGDEAEKHYYGENAVRINSNKGQFLWNAVSEQLECTTIEKVEQNPNAHIMRAQRGQVMYKISRGQKVSDTLKK